MSDDQKPASALEASQRFTDRPLWAYDEDGYCVCCGNGWWKHHTPDCHLADAIDKMLAQVLEVPEDSVILVHIDDPTNEMANELAAGIRGRISHDRFVVVVLPHGSTIDIVKGSVG